MKIDQNKLRKLAAREFSHFSPDELRREENVFFIGGNLPERQTLETLYDSHYQSHAALFHLTFGDMDSFHNGEALARMIKKNFNTHVVGRIEYPASRQLIERAYVAGVDILDIPFSGQGEVLAALDAARSVFPRWSVVSTVVAGAEPSSSTIEAIDRLLALEVVPLVSLPDRTAALQADALSEIFTHLKAGWSRKRVAIKPLMPLIHLTTPLVPASSPGKLRGFIDSIDDRRLLAASDLRRILRVKEVAESFDSAGL